MLSRQLEQTLHRALAYANTRHHEFATLEHLLLALTEDHLDVPAKPQAANDVADLLVTLSPEHRQVVLMRFVDDLTIDEIAAALDIAAGTVKSRLHHAVAALRRAASVER